MEIMQYYFMMMKWEREKGKVIKAQRGDSHTLISKFHREFVNRCLSLDSVSKVFDSVDQTWGPGI